MKKHTKKTKAIIISSGSLLAVAAPIASVISCGENKKIQNIVDSAKKGAQKATSSIRNSLIPKKPENTLNPSNITIPPLVNNIGSGTQTVSSSSSKINVINLGVSLLGEISNLLNRNKYYIKKFSGETLEYSIWYSFGDTEQESKNNVSSSSAIKINDSWINKHVDTSKDELTIPQNLITNNRGKYISFKVQYKFITNANNYEFKNNSQGIFIDSFSLS